MTKRFEITITADAPDDLFEQSTILHESKTALAALIEKLAALTKGDVAHVTRVLPMRKPKIVPGNPGGAAPADVHETTDRPGTGATTHAVPGSPHRVRTVARDGEAA